MKYEKIEMIYEGKAKKIWTTDNPDFIIVDYNIISTTTIFEPGMFWSNAWIIQPG